MTCLAAVPQFLDRDTCAGLTRLVRDESLLFRAGISVRRDETGTSCELPVSLSEDLASLTRRLDGVLGVRSQLSGTVRMRRYRAGEGHPAHLDTYQISGFELIATAVVCICAPTRGGETVFVDPERGPLAIRHQRGQLVAWVNLESDGQPDPFSGHLALPVSDGEKIILAWFVYAEIATVAAAREAVRGLGLAAAALAPQRGTGRMLALVDDGVPEETVRLLQAAAVVRGLRTIQVNPRHFDFAPERVLRPGDLLYRPAVSSAADLCEQHLWRPGVASFHRDPGGPVFGAFSPMQAFLRAGLPVAPMRWLPSADREVLRAIVDGLGGFPLVVKAGGRSRGIGVMRVDSQPALVSLADFLIAERRLPQVMTFIPDAIHWRAIVVGDRVVATYRNVIDPGDFRTSGSEAPEDYTASPPDGLAALAVRACHAVRVDHGGVDLLEAADGALYLLEANFPCYYAQAQLHGGVDVAGAMLDHLLDLAEAAGPASDAPWPEL